MQQLTKIFYHLTLNEIYLIEWVEKSGEDDTIFLEYDDYSYLLMNRKVFEQLNLLELGDL